MFKFGEAVEKDPRFKHWLTNEFVERSQYEKYYQVKEDDVVLDIGASVGPFLYSIQDRNPSRVVAVEPLENYHSTLIENSQKIQDRIDYVYQAIGEKDGEFIDLEWSCYKQKTRTITFKTILKDSNIKHIDFLKIDCEGGEYHIFTEENIDWIKENVNYIAGEFHLNTPSMKESFKKVYNLLKEKNFQFKIESVNGINIKESVEDNLEDFVNHYEQVILYINNTKMKKLLFITPHLSTGGLPQYLYTKIKALKGKFDIHLIEWQDITGGKLVVQRNKIQELVTIHTLGEDKGELFDLIELMEPDIIHLEEIPELFMDSNIASKLYSQDNDFYIVETSHDSSFNLNDKKFLPDKFMFVSQYQIDKYSKFDIPSVLVEYPIEYVERPNRVTALKQLKLDPKKKHILNVGLFTPRKNQSEFFQIARMMPQHEFHCVGNQADNFKDYWEPLMKHKPSNVTWWGERDDVEKFYQAMDLFLFTSKGTSKDKETMPLVLREAISYQIPVLMYDLDVYQGYFDKFDNVDYLLDDSHFVYHNLFEINKKLSSNSVLSQPKNVFIVSCYPTTQTENSTTIKCVNALKEFGYDVILTSHTPIDKNLQSLADYCVYDKNNILTTHDFYNKFWAENDKYDLELNLKINSNNKYHGPSVYTNYRNGAELANSLGYENAFFLNYDYILKDQVFINWVEHQINSSVDFYFGDYIPQEGPSLQTYFFAASIKEYLKKFPFINSSWEYEDLVIKYSSPSNGLENLYYNILKKYNFANVFLDNSESFDSDIKESFEHKSHSQVEYYSVVDTNLPNTFAIIIVTNNSEDSRSIYVSVKEGDKVKRRKFFTIDSPTTEYLLIQYDPDKRYKVTISKGNNSTQTINVDFNKLKDAGKLTIKE